MGGGSSGRTGARAHAIISARFIWRKRKIRYSGGCWETEREIKVDCCFLFFVLQIFVLRGTMNSSAGAGNYRKASSKGDKVIYMWSLLCCSLFSPGTITHKKKKNNTKKKKKEKRKKKQRKIHLRLFGAALLEYFCRRTQAQGDGFISFRCWLEQKTVRVGLHVVDVLGCCCLFGSVNLDF